MVPLWRSFAWVLCVMGVQLVYKYRVHRRGRPYLDFFLHPMDWIIAGLLL